MTAGAEEWKVSRVAYTLVNKKKHRTGRMGGAHHCQISSGPINMETVGMPEMDVSEEAIRDLMVEYDAWVRYVAGISISEASPLKVSEGTRDTLMLERTHLDYTW